MPDPVPIDPAFERRVQRFERRVQHAVAMLLNNSSPFDVRQKHGAIVLQSALQQIEQSSIKSAVPRWA